VDKFSLNVWTTKLAIGSVWLVSVFLAACGVYNIFPFVEMLASSKTWGVIVAIPILVICYMIGAVVIHLCNLIFGLNSESGEIHNFVALAQKDNEALINRYEETRHELEFLQASIPTVAALSVSVIWGAIRVLSGGFQLVSILLGVVILVSVPLIWLLTKRLRVQMNVITS